MSEAAALQRNQGLDAMRATAIGLVICCHFARPLEAFGVLGVELFFVLSGYLIGGILLRQVLDRPAFGGAQLVNFWARRWYRTLPAYFVFLLVFFVWSRWGGPAPLAGEGWRYAVFLQNLAWPCGGFFAVSWSLAVEEWFYLLFPLGLLALRRFLAGPAAVWGGIGLFVVGPFLLRGLAGATPDWDEHIRKVVLLRLDALMFGVAIALLERQGGGAWQTLTRRRGILAAVGLGVAVSMPWVFPRLASMPWALSAAFTLLPLALALTLPWWRQLPPLPPAVGRWVERVSLYSYSMYLSHVPVLIACNTAAAALLGGLAGKIVAKPLALALTFAISALSYRFIEQPFLRMRPRER